MQPDRRLNIVCWAFPSWNGDYLKSTVQLMKELSIHHNVLYIDYAYTWKDILFPGKNKSFVAKQILEKKHSLQQVQLVNGGAIHVLSLPPTLPYNWANNTKIYNSIQKINNLLVEKRILAGIDRWGLIPDIAINAFNPFFGKAAKSLFHECPVLYYCYDNIDATVWAAKHGSRLEKEFLSIADGVIFTSEALKASKTFSVPAHVVNNGVDIRNFSKFQSAHVSSRERKVVGYTGSVDDRLDYDLLEKLISSNPQFDFQFIGRILTEQTARLEKFENVKFYGAKPAEELPMLMASFDAGIIPFVTNEFTKNIYPMKVNEYLAMGIPVISTNFASLNDLHGYIGIGNTSTEFISLVNEMIDNDNSTARRSRIQKANENSWEQKGKEFETILFNYAS
jgi:glycosyltransferase involved in cell wall biosynthesis